jgi:23S rRNA (cytidine1920-2'-O)/16S rRNA (cytidine1409-2'-O)-methyltransferase
VKEAAAIVMSGAVFASGKRLDKPGTRIAAGLDIRVDLVTSRPLGRGSLKLAGALDDFSVPVVGKVALDVGSSTGGFTECLLGRGAVKVYAVDVGKGLLHWKLRNDPRVVVREGVNARRLDKSVVGEKVQIAVIDVSFISLKLVIPPAVELLEEGGELVALVKPQFEAGREEVGRGGIVRDEGARLRAVEKVEDFCRGMGLKPAGRAECKVRGRRGNVEYFIRMVK